MSSTARFFDVDEGLLYISIGTAPGNYQGQREGGRYNVAVSLRHDIAFFVTIALIRIVGRWFKQTQKLGVLPFARIVID